MHNKGKCLQMDRSHCAKNQHIFFKDTIPMITSDENLCAGQRQNCRGQRQNCRGQRHNVGSVPSVSCGAKK